ncbi:IucA/IucC family protein [Halobacillus litoralis]|uniref:IucA/IucC family protein n=1 Tax=Halobacillus litoralis TaxID=45668 RepID=UPI0013E8B26D|nr:IucA/IucC family protein [Halobacillus litoralis]
MKRINQPVHSIKNKYPDFEKNYIIHLKKAEKVILHQLIQAIIREGVFDYVWVADGSSIHISLCDGESLQVPVGRVSALSHLDLDGKIIHSDIEGNKHPITTPLVLLDVLYDKENLSKNQLSFYKEIANSVENYGLALTIAGYRQKKVEQEARQLNAKDVYSLVSAEQQKSHSFSPLAFFEQWVIQGHTIHPCSRTRLGMSAEDIACYAPEWGGEPEVIPLVVHHHICRVTALDNQNTKTILFQEYPELEQAFEELCESRLMNEDEYEIIPVHPWQFTHTVRHNYHEALEKGRIIPLENVRIKTAALISFRTLAPLNNRTKHHIKTAMNVQMTSAIRTVSAASTINGPLLSRLFQEMLRNDSFLSSRLTLMSDEVGIHYEPEGEFDEKQTHFLQKNMAAILRGNPEQELQEDEIAIPAAALLSKSPVSGRLIVEELVQRQEQGSVFEASQAFMKKYARALLPGILTLITKYGISMEAHLQNCVIVFRNGSPERVILRDIGGIRIMNERLDRYFDKQPIDPSTNLLTAQRNELLDIFSHALLHNHLGEIIYWLSRDLKVDEMKLWAIVRSVIEETYTHLKQDPTIGSEAMADENHLFSQPSRMKALVQMRLSDKYTDNIYVNLPNPLSMRNEVLGT